MTPVRWPLAAVLLGLLGGTAPEGQVRRAPVRGPLESFLPLVLWLGVARLAVLGAVVLAGTGFLVALVLAALVVRLLPGAGG